jgi:hypothetical protein
VIQLDGYKRIIEKKGGIDMSNFMKALIVPIIIVLAMIVATLLSKKNDVILNNYVGIIINLASSLIGYWIGIIISNWNMLWIWLQCNTIYFNKKIRVSISYLYRIKVDDKYLLIQSNRIKGQYQPIGGVYKRFNTASDVFDKLKIVDVSGYAADKDGRNDLRVKVPSKNLVKFIKWFESREDRELDPLREFYEELVGVGILSKENFPHFNYKFIRQVRTNIHFSEHFQCSEMLIYNIYELLPNEKQLQELGELNTSKRKDIRWFTYDEINALGHTPERDIRVGQHSKHIL